MVKKKGFNSLTSDGKPQEHKLSSTEREKTISADMLGDKDSDDDSMETSESDSNDRLQPEAVNNQEESDDEGEGPRDQGGFTILGEFKPKEKKQVKRVLPNWLQHPVLISKKSCGQFSDVKNLDLTLVQKLRENKIETCSPVQWTVLPELLAQSQCGLYVGDAGFRPRDVCVSAPTGSGKTLTFALPIIQALKDRVVPHVRALVILPVRDLAIQVYKVFKQYSESTSLRVVLLAGKKEFHAEQMKLVKERPYASVSERWCSVADIVVATKGRLLDHIERTPGFDLTHLRFLVIDEADRQMEDIYDNWLSHVETAAYTPKQFTYSPYHRPKPTPLTVASSEQTVMHMQKLLFSATLSQNPEKLEQMNLHLPLLFTTVAPEAAGSTVEDPQTFDADKFSTPSMLKEKFMDCKAAEKPLVLFHFVLNEHLNHVLCFTNSVESSHRLYLLAKQFEEMKVAEISSLLHTAKRERIIRKFERGDIHMLICSDMMTRGMDIGNVEYVISYDAPPYIETYIHRIGRTARANKAGTAISLLEGKEMYHFKKMLRDSGRWRKLKRISVTQSSLQPLVPTFSKALKMLPEILTEQRRQKKKS
ncbi:ATP-dependent RNA helicase ddx51-like [Plakobranchus ocellatus]|uniref:ATP-dependent RNA helicase n=1 Tax=Plakobranchus ocellatus TaxID=259542 RepID=A0AAV4CF90_9GAST|nr:ATP-dependent RNA helicase ddx51-like [Plakobranchus ocellatus]